MPKLTKIPTYKLQGRIKYAVELRSDHFLLYEMPKMVKKLPYNLHG